MNARHVLALANCVGLLALSHSDRLVLCSFVRADCAVLCCAVLCCAVLCLRYCNTAVDARRQNMLVHGTKTNIYISGSSSKTE